ncbi:MAG: dihydrolipoamide acetyltransferase family protein [Microbacteriaceae bacterium]
MIDILMPRLSDTITEGTITAWLKKPGDTVAPGEVLVEIETDKALMEQEAYEAGVLSEVLVKAGENVAIGTPIARLDDGSGAAPAPTPAATPEPAPAETAEAADRKSVPTPAGTAAPSNVRSDRRAATPLVRKIAKERGIDLTTVVGSGPGGRIVRADIDATPSPQADPRPPMPVDALATRADARDPVAVPFDAMRHAIASRLTESGTTIPTFTVTASADVSALLALRALINAANSDTGAKVSVNDLLVRAVAVALRAHPQVNASYSAEGRGQALIHGRVHIGIAVASPAGLVVPVVHDADRKAVSTISTLTKELVSKASERKLSAEDMTDGTFTISNLGMYGIEHFTAIINPPQGAILAVGAARDELTLVAGEAVAVKRMRYTLTADHRIIDGALAARFIATLTELLEQPLRIVV